jgi:hypothetical protein
LARSFAAAESASGAFRPILTTSRWENFSEHSERAGESVFATSVSAIFVGVGNGARRISQHVGVLVFQSGSCQEDPGMLKMSWAKSAAVIAGLNIVAPQALVSAADKVSPQTVPAKAASDVVLTSKGELQGRVVTAQGAPVDGAIVSLTLKGKPIAKTNSDESGEFRLASVKGGVYELTAGQNRQLVRVWSNQSAPPTARQSATIVQGTVVRGQDEWDYFETDEMVIAGIATAGLVTGIVALIEVDDDDNGNPVSP